MLVGVDDQSPEGRTMSMRWKWGGRRCGLLPGGSTHTKDGGTASTNAESAAMGSLVPGFCCCKPSFDDDDAQGVGATEAGGRDTAGASVEEDDQKDRISWPMLELDYV